MRKQLAVLIERVDAYDERIQETRKTLERTSRMLKDAKRTRKT